MNEDNQKCCEPMATQASMEKKFNECSIEEKISRLHRELCDLRHSYQWLGRTNHELRQEIEKLKNHQHSESGVCLIPISYSSPYGGDIISVRNFDPLN